MRITPLASGSGGNCLLVQTDHQQLLVDVGLALDDVTARLRRVGADPRDTTAILLTHRHRDHRRGVAEFSRAFTVPIYGTRTTLRCITNQLRKRLRRIEIGAEFAIGRVAVKAFAVTHDAPCTVGFRITASGRSFGIATDLGCDDGAIAGELAGLDALLLEFNYEPALLDASSYPKQLRERIASSRGHLSNEQSARLLEKLSHPGLRRVWLGHLSQRTNTPEHGLRAARSAIGDSGVELVVAMQAEPTPTLELM